MINQRRMKTQFGETSKQCKARRGFTLVELAVVMGMIALLAMILTPGLCGARPDTLVLKCRNNLRQLQTGWQMYLG